MLGAFYHHMAVADQVDQQVAQGSVSLAIEAVQTGPTRPMAIGGLWTIGPVILGTLATCFWMTFFWAAQSPEHLRLSTPVTPRYPKRSRYQGDVAYWHVLSGVSP